MILSPPVFGGHQLGDIHQVSGVVAGVAGVAVIVLGIAHSRAEAADRKITQRIGFDEAPDLLDRIIGRDELG